MDLYFGTSGHRAPAIVLCGEAWGREELAVRTPFVGQAGKELFRMLGEAFPSVAPSLHAEALSARNFGEWTRLREEWLVEAKILYTNIVHERPPENELSEWCYPTSEAKAAQRPLFRGLYPNDTIVQGVERLHELLRTLKPKLVIAAGNWPMWALSTMGGISNVEGKKLPSGIVSWRGSMGFVDESIGVCAKCLPIIHPASILREWYWRAPSVHDLRRSHFALVGDWRMKEEPRVLAPPTFAQAFDYFTRLRKRLEQGLLPLVADIETSRGLITCIGLAAGLDEACVLPFVRLTPSRGFDNFWSKEEEGILLRELRFVLHHPSTRVIGQNFIYDIQYLQMQFGINPKLFFDTMLAHHLLFPGTPKGLDYLSSMYCHYHWYWKDDGKEWDTKGTLEQHLAYNAIDLFRTFEAYLSLSSLIEKQGFSELWAERLAVNDLALSMMNRGVRVDSGHRSQLALDLTIASQQLSTWFEKVLPQSIVASEAKTPWYNSPIQQRRFFGEALGLRLPIHRKTGQPTFGKDALRQLTERHPEYTRLFEALEDFRSVGVFHKTFIRAPLDYDGRMRCSYNVAGTETFRWSSSENPFGRGTNLQNIPEGTEK